MSVVKANTYLAASGSPTEEPSIPALDQRMAKAWVNFNGTGTVAILDSYKVSSVTDNGTGNYIINFAVAMNNTNYALFDGFTGGAGNVLSGYSSVYHTTTSCRLEARRTDTWNPVDAPAAQAAIFGN